MADAEVRVNCTKVLVWTLVSYEERVRGLLPAARGQSASPMTGSGYGTETASDPKRTSTLKDDEPIAQVALARWSPHSLVALFMSIEARKRSNAPR